MKVKCYACGYVKLEDNINVCLRCRCTKWITKEQDLLLTLKRFELDWD
jgi:predicted Zn-ribbon and HTH transcriptional regulator